jgi:predicted acylesterase/phospholipase RssA
MNTEKTLRLGFIMGGGVSLGTFSGAALSEAIKQQLVYGQYNTGTLDEAGNPVYQTYERVEIDVFSGASAGAISLAIMLRILTNPRDKYRFLGFRSYEQMREVLDFRLSRQFGARFEKIKTTKPQKYEQLLAAQTLQEFQEKVWTKEVDIERLLGTGAHYKDLSDKASFLDRTVVDELGKTLFRFEEPESERLSHRTLLADRVLFGCTLANLSHTLQKGSNNQPQEDQQQALLAALSDSSVARIHSELRVFDINFKAIDKKHERAFPLRWVQYHEQAPIQLIQKDQKGQPYNKTVRSLNSNAVWREMAATAIASAAVPVAFEPVVLNRYRYEFGQQWAPALGNKDSYPFTYVDGGVFNNEPVQEALRLAAFIDHATPKANFERQLIFVDPDVSELEQQFRIQAHEKLSVGRSLFSSKMKIAAKSSAARLFSSLTHLLSAILNEAQSIEVDRLSTVLQQFERRDELRQFYRETIAHTPNDETLERMRNSAQTALQKTRLSLQLPDTQLQLPQELLRIIEEEKDFLHPQLPNEERALVDAVNAFCYLPAPSKAPHAQALVFALSCLQLDIALQLIGKNTPPTIVPIAPFDFYNQQETWTLMPLPGKGMAGFTGFASAEASKYEVAYGKYCAARILRALQLTSPRQTTLALPPRFNYEQLEGSLQEQLQIAIVKRFKEMIPSNFSSILPFLSGYLKESVQRFVADNIQIGGHGSTFEFRIRVPNETYVLKGFTKEGNSDRRQSLQTLSIHGAHYLVAKIHYDFVEEQWMGTHTNFMQQIYIEQSKFLEDIPALQVELPVMTEQSDAHLSPHPVFEADIRTALRRQQVQDLSAKIWTLSSEVLPLDQHLWGSDN